MSDPMKKVRPGQKLRIPAQAYNAFIDAAEDFKRRTQHLGRNATPKGRSAGIVTVRNDWGFDRAMYAVMGIDEPIIAPADSEDGFKAGVALSCTQPSIPDHKHTFVVLAEPIPAGKVGRAYAAGVCPVRLYVPNEDQVWEYAAPGDVSDYLVADQDGGAEILWRQGGTGQQWAVVRLGARGARPVLYGKPTEAFTEGASLTLDPCDVAGADNGLPNVTVRVNRDMAYYTMANSTSLPTDAVVPYALADDGFYYMLGTFIELVTDYRVDGPNRKFQKKTRNVWVLTAGTESDWVDVHTGDACPT